MTNKACLHDYFQRTGHRQQHHSTWNNKMRAGKTELYNQVMIEPFNEMIKPF
jgi:hypothetical protein